MCTVTYIRANNKVILTSNRDEHAERPVSEYPRVYFINGKKVVFPRDPKSGGSWFVVDEEANVSVLLNGADTKHEPDRQYRMSRGVILLDLMTSPSVLTAWNTMDLNEIEPFTIIAYWKNNLYQLRWDFEQKNYKKLDASQNHIWSSATLYSSEIQNNRRQWFTQFLASQNTVNEESVRRFHLHTEKNNTENGLVINRSNKIKTLSLTQAVIVANKANLFYHDLVEEKTFSNSFVIL